MRKQCYDVAIIGGGVVGCAIARELTRYRLAVLLLEKECDVGFGTTKANSGIIHGGHHASPQTLKGRLEWAGNQLWDGLCAELGFGFRRNGELTVAFAEDELPILDKLLANSASQGISGLQCWDQTRIRKEEPNLAPEVIAAIYAPTTGVINPYEAAFGLAESALRNGLDLRTDCPVQQLSTDGAIWTIGTTKENFTTRFVLNAAGLFSDKVAEMAGVQTFSIHPRKGEEYLLDKRLVGLVQHVIFPCPTPVSKGILIIPTYDGTIMVGPTAHDTEKRNELTTSFAGSAEVFSAVKRIVPGISERDVIAQFAGLRAAADGEDFIIGPTTKRGFINVAGIQSPGLTAAPAIAQMVVEILCNEGLRLELKDHFEAILPSPVHFASLSTNEQIALASIDPRYRRMVCRCEFITEGEVLDAIGRGANTLDGIKFRTRAGMGRCQGGFCTARCMELLAQKLHLPMSAITKRGGDSWLVREPGNEVE